MVINSHTLSRLLCLIYCFPNRHFFSLARAEEDYPARNSNLSLFTTPSAACLQNTILVAASDRHEFPLTTVGRDLKQRAGCLSVSFHHPHCWLAGWLLFRRFWSVCLVASHRTDRGAPAPMTRRTLNNRRTPGGVGWSCEEEEDVVEDRLT